MLCALRGLPASDNGSCDLGKALLNISFDWRKLGGQLKLASQVVYCSCSFSQKMNYDISASEYNLDKCHCAILETGSRRWSDVCPPFREVSELAQLRQPVPKGWEKSPAAWQSG